MHSQREKGQKWELECCEIMREVFTAERGWVVRRGLQGRGGIGCSDVEVLRNGNHPSILHLECKHGQKLSVRAALAQAQADHRPGALPIVIIKDNQEAPGVPANVFAAMPMPVLLDLLRLLERDYSAILPVDTLPSRNK